MTRLITPGFADDVLAATSTLCDEVDSLDFSDPVACIYNPLRYAWPLHEQYVRRWGASQRRVLPHRRSMNSGRNSEARTSTRWSSCLLRQDAS